MLNRYPQDHIFITIPDEEDETGLSTLPNELIYHILNQLPPKDIRRLSQVSRQFHAICREYLLTTQRPDAIQWRIRQFKTMQNDLRDEIDESYAKQCSSTRLALLCSLGSVFSGLAASIMYQNQSASDSTSYEGNLILGAMFITSLIILFTGIVGSINNCRLNYKIKAYEKNIVELDQKLAAEHFNPGTRI